MLGTNRRMPRQVRVRGVRWFERQRVRDICMQGVEKSPKTTYSYVSVLGSIAGPIFYPRRMLGIFCCGA